MNITPTNIAHCYEINTNVFEDSRGYFFEGFNKKLFEQKIGYKVDFVQDNQSKSTKGVVRGLHIQRPPYAQAKLVRVLSGKVLDVVVDARKDSPTFGNKFSIELSDENKKQLFVPKGLLHGFSVLSEEAVFFYKCDNYYDKESEDSVNPLDIDLNIDWRVNKEDILLSDKDKSAQRFKDLKPIVL